MKFLRGLAGWLAFLAAILVATTAAALFVLEATGHLADVVRRQLAEALDVELSYVTVDRAELSWFRPGLHAYGVRIDAVGPGHVALDTVHVDVGPGGGEWTEILRGLRIEGGDVLYSTSLAQMLIRPTAQTRDDEPATRPPIPPIHVRDLAFSVHTPDPGELAIGELDLTLERDRLDLLRARGRLEPSFADPDQAHQSAIHFFGEEDPKNRFRVFASTRDFPIGSDELPFELARRWSNTEIPEGIIDGRLTLFAQGSFRLDGSRPPAANLRASLAEGRIDFGSAAPPVESLATDIDLTYAPSPGQTYENLSAWDLAVNARGQWLETSFDTWLAAGRRASPGYDVEIWGRAPELPLRPDVFELIPEPGTLRAMIALEPRGRADTRFAVRFPPWRGGVRTIPDALLHVSIDGDASLRVVGWENLLTGEREGVPIRVDDVRGRYVLAGRAGATLPFEWRSGIVGVSGRAGTGRARAEGTVGSPPTRGHAFLDLAIEVDDLPVDERLRAGLDGLTATREIWDTYGLRSGRVGARWHLLRDELTEGLAHRGDLTFADAALTWRELPVPLRDVNGKLALRWARPAGVRVPPLGARFEAEGRSETVEGVTLRGEIRDDVAPGREAAPAGGRRIQGLDVQATAVPLKGSDWNVLRERFPQVAEQVEAFTPRGKADVSYRSWAPQLGPSVQLAVEVTPIELNLQPRQFQMRAHAVRGRVLATSTLPREPGSAESPESFETNIALAGRWSGDVTVAASGSVTSASGGLIVAAGAGVDPSNLALRGALSEATGNDLSALAIDGRVDFQSEFEVRPDGDPEGEYGTHRIFLHRNDLAIRDFGLNSLSGMLVVREGVLHGARLDALVADTPVQLRNAFFASSEDAVDLEGADALVNEPGMLPTAPASVLQADLYAQDLPLDSEHLLSIARNSTELDRVMTDQSWRGQVDLEGTRLIVVQEESGRFKTAIRGDLLLHGISFDPGLQVVIPSARVNLRGLFVESGRVRGWAELSDLYARVADRELGRARALVSYIDGRLTLDDLAGAFEGGRIHSLGAAPSSGTALRIDLREPFGFDITMAIEGVQIGELLEGVFDSSLPDEGLLDGQLRLAGSLQDPLGLRGEGSGRITRARLWSIPVIRELFSQLGFDGTAVFDKMSSRFRIADGRIRFSEVRAYSPLLKLVGYNGSLDLDGRLDFDLEVRYSLIDSLGPLTRLLYWIQNSLLRVAVRGDMSRPRVILRNAVSEFFVGDSLDDRELPLPDFTPVPDRF